MNTLYPNELEEVAKIIERSRREEERVLPDSKTAAFDVMQYLHTNGNLKAKVIQLNNIQDEREEARAY